MPETASTRPASAGPGEHPQALDRRGDDVRHRQLLGRARELREEGDLSWSKRRAHGRRQAREDVDERDRCVGDDDDERAEHEQRADEVAREHHVDAAVAIPECRRRGRRERAERPQHEHRAHGGRAALLVRVHAERDLEAVVTDDGSGPRDLQQPQLAVAEDRADGSVVVRRPCSRHPSQRAVEDLADQPLERDSRALRDQRQVTEAVPVRPEAGQRVALEKVQRRRRGRAGSRAGRHRGSRAPRTPARSRS